MIIDGVAIADLDLVINVSGVSVNYRLKSEQMTCCLLKSIKRMQIEEILIVKFTHRFHLSKRAVMKCFDI